MFNCMPRVSDLIDLEDDDIDFQALTLRFREGKRGRSALLPIPSECAQIPKSYLQVRPSIQIDGKHPLFYTDHQNKWTRRSFATVFTIIKKKAGIFNAADCTFLVCIAQLLSW